MIHSWKIRRDGPVTVGFDRLTGLKYRISDDVEFNYVKSSHPELVDVKITDFCPFECAFCYQGSTKKGVHASIENIEKILSMLSAENVFEVALGGGETTMHPRFADILKMCRDLDIVPNFTTFSKAWLKSEAVVDSVRNHVGGIGVSVHAPGQYAVIRSVSEVFPEKFVLAQHVVGTCTLDDTVKLITEMSEQHVPVLLLGYKNVGFGSSFTSHDMSGLIDALHVLKERDIIDPHLSVDTSFLKLFPNFEKVLNIPEVSIGGREEGKFSMYVDAVEMKMGPSSYVDKNEMSDISNIEASEFWNRYKEY